MSYPTGASAQKIPSHSGPGLEYPDCDYRDANNVCLIASTLAAGHEAWAAPHQCILCSKQDKPRGVNRITAAMASKARRRCNLPPDPGLEAAMRFKPGGCGTELARVFDRWHGYLSRLGLASLMSVDDETCGCGDIKEAMDGVGWLEVYEQRRGITKRIVDNYLRKYPRRALLAPVMRALVRRGIRLAIRQHRENVADEQPSCGGVAGAIPLPVIRAGFHDQPSVPEGST